MKSITVILITSLSQTIPLPLQSLLSRYWCYVFSEAFTTIVVRRITHCINSFDLLILKPNEFRAIENVIIKYYCIIKLFKALWQLNNVPLLILYQHIVTTDCYHTLFVTYYAVLFSMLIILLHIYHIKPYLRLYLNVFTYHSNRLVRSK